MGDTGWGEWRHPVGQQRLDRGQFTAPKPDDTIAF